MKEVEVIALIGKKNWKEFEKYMYGQTVGKKDGEIDYYSWDVLRFQAYLDRD
jgi:hypothetical protein